MHPDEGGCMPLDDIIILTAGALIIGWVLYKFWNV